MFLRKKTKEIRNGDFKKIGGNYSKEEGTILDNLYYIWGIKSKDDLSKEGPANFYTLNDLDLIYDISEGVFGLAIETSYHFSSKLDQDRYLLRLLKEFEKFVESKGFIKEIYFFTFNNCDVSFASKSLPDLLARFRVFVKGTILEEEEVWLSCIEEGEDK